VLKHPAIKSQQLRITANSTRLFLSSRRLSVRHAEVMNSRPEPLFSSYKGEPVGLIGTVKTKKICAVKIKTLRSVVKNFHACRLAPLV
jgi:hypothetical protein